MIDNAKYIDAVMPMYNLIKYSHDYSKISGRLRQYYNNNPNDNIKQSESFKHKIKISGKTLAAGKTKDVEIAVPLKYLRVILGELVKGYQKLSCFRFYNYWMSLHLFFCFFSRCS